MKQRTKSIREKRAKKLIKFEWIERIEWIKQIEHIQFLAPQDVNNEEGD